MSELLVSNESCPGSLISAYVTQHCYGPTCHESEAFVGHPCWIGDAVFNCALNRIIYARMRIWITCSNT